MTDPNCIFCKILAKQIPSAPVYEDAYTLAFLDIAPFEKGHTLVIPKFHAERLTDLPADWLLRLMPAVQQTAALLLQRLPCDGFNLLQSNGACATQVVPHVHFHVVPRWNGRAMRWTAIAYDHPAEMQEIAARLRNDSRHMGFS
ncbi:MAG: HIT domain-containing protein [Kiritimatiellia bacterium]